MVLNWLFENLLSCINLTNGYYPKKIDTLSGTPKKIRYWWLVLSQNFQQKITYPIIFLIINISIFHQVFCLETHQPQIYQPINRDFSCLFWKLIFSCFFGSTFLIDPPKGFLSTHILYAIFIVYICMI
jgi:hypothetical protein